MRLYKRLYAAGIEFVLRALMWSNRGMQALESQPPARFALVGIAGACLCYWFIPVSQPFKILLTVVCYIVLTGAVQLMLFAVHRRTTVLEDRLGNAYIGNCIEEGAAPALPFVLYLRPFGLDFSSRFAFAIGSPRGPASFIWRDAKGRPRSSHGSLIAFSKVIRSATEGFGLWVEVTPQYVAHEADRSIVLPHDGWEHKIQFLCHHARLIITVPLIDIDLSESLESFTWSDTSDGVSAAMNAIHRDGVKRELPIVCAPGISQKTIFAVPGGLKGEEICATRMALRSHGIDLPEASDPPSADTISLYRHVPSQSQVVGTSVYVHYGVLSKTFWPMRDEEALIRRGSAFAWLMEDDPRARAEAYPKA